MNMNTTLHPIQEEDREPLIGIFNHYIENSMAAYLVQALPLAYFDVLMKLCEGYPAYVAKDEIGSVAGFGILRPYHPAPAFSATAEITYFLHPQATGAGIGKLLLERLVEEGRSRGLKTILASISSANEGSIRFHLKNGFTECGRFLRIGTKQGRSFDVVYCQRFL